MCLCYILEACLHHTCISPRLVSKCNFCVQVIITLIKMSCDDLPPSTLGWCFDCISSHSSLLWWLLPVFQHLRFLHFFRQILLRSMWFCLLCHLKHRVRPSLNSLGFESSFLWVFQTSQQVPQPSLLTCWSWGCFCWFCQSSNCS